MDIENLVDNFAVFDDWEDRYAYLIDLGGQLSPMDPLLKTNETRVPGCISQVWMILRIDENGKLDIIADSDAQIVRGLIAVLSILFSGKTRAEARAIDVVHIFETIGLHQHLSVNRRNGFFAMLEKIKGFIAQDT